jgi:uncharacterized protein (DUF427 family)
MRHFRAERTLSSPGGAAMIKAIWNGQTIAQAATVQSVDGYTYFPADAVHWEFLRPSPSTTVCHWKGSASYYSVVVEGKENPDAAWCYQDPKAAAQHIKGQIGFWRGVKIAKG